MRVLAISFMLPPMLYPQAIQIGRLLGAAGVDLITVSGKLSDRSILPAGPAVEGASHILHQIEIPHQVHLGGMAVRLLPIYGKVPDVFIAWAHRAIATASDWLEKKPEKIDVIASFGEPMSDHLVGLELKRRFGLPWLAHFSDPWADNPFRRLQPVANWRNRILEARVIKEADCIVFTSAETLELVMAKYPSAWKAKAKVLPHSFDPRHFSDPVKQPADNEKLVLRYLGNFYGHRTPFPLLAALDRWVAQHVNQEPDFRVEIVGSLSKWMRCHSAWRRLPPGLLTLRNTVSYQQSLALMQQSDLLLVIDAPAKNSVFFPSKLADYIGAGRPILGITPSGASQKLIHRLGGITANPANPLEIDRALAQALDMARRARKTWDAWGEPTVRAEFTVERVAKSFVELLDWTRASAA